MRNRIFLLLPAFLLIHVFLLVNLRFTAWPEMLSYPYLRNQGFLLYKDMIHPYPPILTMALSFVYKLFGYKLGILEIISWALSVFSSVLVYLITKYLTKKEWPAILSLGLYVFLQPFLEGNMLWFDTAIVLPILLGFYLLIRRNYFLSGVFFASAGFIKQTAAIFWLLVFIWLMLSSMPSSLARPGLARLKRIAQFSMGAAIFGLLLLFRLLQERSFQDFLNWTVIYPMTEWEKFPNYVQMSVTRQQGIVLLLLFLPALFLLVFRKWYREKTTCLLLLFLIGGGLAVYPRFSFFHLQPALAFLVIFYGYLLAEFKKFTTPLLLAIIFYGALLFWFIQLPVLQLDWKKEARFWGTEEQSLAQIVQQTTLEKEKVFLLGVHSGIYAMSSRQPPKRWTDNFGWYLEIPGVQEEIISRWEQNPPMYIFWRTPRRGNWFDLGTYQPRSIVEYVKTNYNFEREISPGIQIWKRKS